MLRPYTVAKRFTSVGLNLNPAIWGAIAATGWRNGIATGRGGLGGAGFVDEVAEIAFGVAAVGVAAVFVF